MLHTFEGGGYVNATTTRKGGHITGLLLPGNRGKFVILGGSMGRQKTYEESLLCFLCVTDPGRWHPTCISQAMAWCLIS